VKRWMRRHGDVITITSVILWMPAKTEWWRWLGMMTCLFVAVIWAWWIGYTDRCGGAHPDTQRGDK
jgi:hypothetical protein